MANYYGKCERCDNAVVGKEYVALCYDCLWEENKRLWERVERLENVLRRIKPEEFETFYDAYVAIFGPPACVWCKEEQRYGVFRLMCDYCANAEVEHPECLEGGGIDG